MWPQLRDRQIDSVIEIAKTGIRPDQLPKFLSRNDLSVTLQECCQHLKRLVLQLQPHSRLAHFPCLEIRLEIVEAND